MIAPKFFLRELDDIDKSYFPEWNEKNEYWEIKKRMNVNYIKRGYLISVVNPTIAVYRYLNDNALNDIRRRKKLSERFPGSTYLEWIMSQAKEAKKKKMEIAVEIATEGFMKIFQQGKSKQFDMHIPEN